MKREMTNITQKLWGWKVAAHLFLVAAGAGAYIAGFFLLIIRSGIQPLLLPPGSFSPFLVAAEVGIVVAVPLLIAGGICIVSNLGYKANAVRAFNRPWSSWLSAGGVLMLLFTILDLVFIGTWLNAPSAPLNGGNLALGIVNLVLAIAILIYSGMLLKALKPFAFWNTWLLPLLFFLSGLTTGIMVTVFAVAIYGFVLGDIMVQPLLLCLFYLNFLMILQAIAIALYLWRAAELPSTKSSFLLIAKERFALSFWLAVVAVGTIIPVALGFFLVSAPPRSLALSFILALIVTVSGLAGGYVLRYLVLRAGTCVPINAGGQYVALPETARIPASHRVHYR